MKIVLLCFLFIGWIQCQQPFYFINIPNSLANDVNYHFPVFSSVNIKIEITTREKKTESSITTKQFIIEANKTFNIPYTVQFVNTTELILNIRADSDDIGRLTAQTRINGDFIDKTISVPIYNDGDIILGETNQPLYKPGDLVKFRVFALGMLDLKASKKPRQQWLVTKVNGRYVKQLYNKSADYSFSSISVISPDGNKMFEWNDVKMATTMNLSYKILKDPVFGKWKIVAKLGKKTETINFIVKKFVLAKFVVKVKPPKPLFSDEYVNFSVCSTYSTGKPMKAMIKGKYCLLYKRIARRCLRFEEHLRGNKKCAEIKFQTNQIFYYGYYNLYRYEESSVLNVTVTEKDTKHSIFKSIKGKGFSRQPYNIDLLSDKYFKPEMSYLGQIKLNKINGEPKANEIIEITFQYDFKYKINVTSDNAGIANFTIHHMKTTRNINLEFISGKRYKNPMRSPYQKYTLKPLISSGNKFIEILKTDYLLNRSKIECPDNINISFVTNVKWENLSFIYVSVIGRGQVQSSGVQTFKLEKEDTCEKRDDHIGHYLCLGNGKIQCREGWTGDNCREIVCDECCYNGVCVSKDKCVCEQGWKGVNCAKCTPRNGCRYGYCEKVGDCICYPGWISRNCDKFDFDKSKNYRMRTKEYVACKTRSTQKQTIFQYNIPVKIPQLVGPDVQIIVYTLTRNQDVISDKLKLELKNCVTDFKENSTKFEFGTDDLLTPGDNLTLQLRIGTKQKSCAIRINDVAIDQFRKSSTVNLDSLITNLKRFNSELINTEYKRRYLNKCGETSKYDVYAAFLESGIRVISNLQLNCSNKMNSQAQTYNANNNPTRSNSYRFDANDQNKNANNRKTKILQYFPANWVFQYYKDMPRYINYTVPDSITTWKANLYCFTENGLYLSPTRYLKVEPQFYVYVYLPYSIKLTEKLEFPVKIFNNAYQSYEIRTYLKVNRREFRISGSVGSSNCICAHQTILLRFRVQPKLIGDGHNITIFTRSRKSEDCDEFCGSSVNLVVEMSTAVRRKIKVEAPGVQKESTLSELICVQNEKNFKFNRAHRLPENIFPGSLRTYLVIMGNILGPSMENMKNLFKMPRGCVEQTTAQYMSTIYGLYYLKAIKADKKGKGKQLAKNGYKYLKSGIRFLNSMRNRSDGSFPVFQTRRPGSTWLTAFIVRTFSAAYQLKDDIVEVKTMQKAVDYLASMQNYSNVYFKEKASPITSSTTGNGRSNVDRGLLASYVMISIGLASPIVNTSAINVPAALKYIRNDLYRDKSNSAYRLALAAYAHALNDKESIHTKKMINDLINTVQVKDDYKFWRHYRNSYELNRQVTSIDIETTGYAVLALVAARNKGFDFLSVNRWLVSLQSSRGAYSTTQDTVVALQALSMIEITKMPNVTIAVNIKAVIKKKGVQNIRHNSTLTKTNFLNMHKWEVPPIYNKETNVSIFGQGQGCAVVQLVSMYTVKNTNEKLHGSDIFTISAIASCQRGGRRKADVRVCSGYLRKGKSLSEDGMLIIVVSLPSGWKVSDEKKQYLVSQSDTIPKLYKVEFSASDTQVNLYYKGFKSRDAWRKTKRCFDIPIFKYNYMIRNIQSAVVSITDYYIPDLTVSTQYSIHC